MSRPVHLGIIGAGRIGALHAETLTHRVAGARVESVCDVNLDTARKVAADLGIPRACSDYREVLAAKEVEAVLVCSSTDTHATIVMEAAAAGKHVFCEKPVDLELARVLAVNQAVERAGIKFMVGFNRRFDHNFAHIAAMVREGKVGEPHLVRISSRDPHPPPAEYVKVSGGMFLDMTIHDFDMARFLTGQEVVEVSAFGACLVDPAIGAAGDIDTAAVTMRYAGGALCTIDNSRKAVYGYDQRVEVFGAAGCLVAHNNEPHDVESWNEHGQTRALPHFFFLQRYREAYAREMTEFVSCLRSDAKPAVGGADGLRSLELALAAKLSLQRGRPVKVEEVRGR